ncbi:hypothetical protein [Vreelandella sp. EE27]
MKLKSPFSVLTLFIGILTCGSVLSREGNKMEVFSNEYFSLGMPAGWKTDDSYDGIGLKSPDGKNHCM